jgi:hypothetical protein
MRRETIEEAAVTVVDPVVAVREQVELLEGEPDPSARGRRSGFLIARVVELDRLMPKSVPGVAPVRGDGC